MKTNNTSTRVLVILLLLVIVPSGFTIDTDRSSQEDDIREAVFRYQFDHNASGLQKRAHAFCLVIGLDDKNSDPSDQFMKRFAHHKPAVRKASSCHWNSIQVVENRTGRAALVFWCSKITWVSDIEVSVDGGYEEGNVSASSSTYTVRKQNGKWAVTNDRMTMISKAGSLRIF